MCVSVCVYMLTMETPFLEEVLYHPFVLFKTNYGYGLVYTCNPSIQKVEASQSKLQTAQRATVVNRQQSPCTTSTSLAVRTKIVTSITVP